MAIMISYHICVCLFTYFLDLGPSKLPNDLGSLQYNHKHQNITMQLIIYMEALSHTFIYMISRLTVAWHNTEQGCGPGRSRHHPQDRTDDGDPRVWIRMGAGTSWWWWVDAGGLGGWAHCGWMRYYRAELMSSCTNGGALQAWNRANCFTCSKEPFGLWCCYSPIPGLLQKLRYESTLMNGTGLHSGWLWILVSLRHQRWLVDFETIIFFSSTTSNRRGMYLPWLVKINEI